MLWSFLTRVCISSRDPSLAKYGREACEFRLDIEEVYSPIIAREEDVKHEAKGLALDFRILGSKLRYLYMAKLIHPEDELSAIELDIYFAMHTDRIEAFYCLLLGAICSRKEASEMKRERALSSSSDLHTPPSERTFSVPAPLLEESLILGNGEEYKEGLTAIRNNLPARYGYRPWTLVYSTDRDGISMRTFYELNSDWSCSLVFIETRRGAVFGGYASAPWQPQDHYFGCGESFLFTLYPTLAIYPWANPANSLFMFASKDHFEMGGGYVGCFYGSVR